MCGVLGLSLKSKVEIDDFFINSISSGRSHLDGDADNAVGLFIRNIEVSFSLSDDESTKTYFINLKKRFNEIVLNDLKDSLIPKSVPKDFSANDGSQPELIYAVVGYPNSVLGVGMSAVYLHNYLTKFVNPVYLVDIPLEHLKNQVRNLNSISISLEHWAERIKSFSVNTKIVYIICVNGDRQLDWLKINKLKRVCDYFIGYFVWELEVYPTTFNFGLEFVDEVWDEDEDEGLEED